MFQFRRELGDLSAEEVVRYDAALRNVLENLVSEPFIEILIAS